MCGVLKERIDDLEKDFVCQLDQLEECQSEYSPLENIIKNITEYNKECS